MNRFALSAAAFVMALSPIVSRLDAQDWQSQVRAELLGSRIVRSWLASDYRLSHDVHVTVIPSSSYRTVTLDLRQGYTYKFIGKCDYDCTDIDFRLYDENGNVVDSDDGSDDYPVVAVTPIRTATFRLRIDMARCSTSDCGVGVLVVRR
jgi:hypothetical protein